MKILAAVIQLTSTPDREANLERIAELLAEAAARGARLAVLPENFAWFGGDEATRLTIAETIELCGESERPPSEGPILTALRAVAARHQMALLLGGMAERAELGRVYNSAVYLDPAGAVRAVYRKLHLFDVALRDGSTYRESQTVVAGQEPVVVDTPWGGLGLSICYDVRFPELYRALSANGARLLAIPAAFTLHTGRDHWHLLCRARAVENLAYVLAAAQYGRHSAERVTYGHSLIVDPWGQILAEVGDHDGIAVAELDFAYQDRLRRELPALGHRRLR